MSVTKAADDIDVEPAFTSVTDDGQKLALAFIRETQQGANDSAGLRHVSFFPWQAWPPSPELAPSFVAFVGKTLMKEFRVTPSMFFGFGALIAHTSVVFAPQVSSDGENTGPLVAIFGDAPAFAATRGPELHVVGAVSNANELHASVVDSSVVPAVVTSTKIACANSLVFGGAVPYEKGWLLAYSTGKNTPQAECGLPEFSGEPTRIDIAKLSAAGTPEFMGGLEVPTPLIALRLAPHPDGMYLVWREASGGGVPPIRWARYDVPKAGLVGPGEVSTPDDYPLEFAVAALGDRLAVAYGSDPANNPPDLVVRVFDPFGAPVAMHAFEPSFFGKLALIGSPNAHSLLLAFQNGGANPGIDVARLDCVD